MLKVIARWLCGVFFVSTGVSHFINPDPFVLIVPPYLPYPVALVWVSGVFEVLGGIGLVAPPARRFAAWGLVALLVAVYPANIHMLVNEIYLPDMPHEKWLLWARMPLQFVLVAWVLWTAEIWPKPQNDT
jgi:uncharacterized membrane protein